jgi:hypothetical protein
MSCVGVTSSYLFPSLITKGIISQSNQANGIAILKAFHALKFVNGSVTYCPHTEKLCANTNKNKNRA